MTLARSKRNKYHFRMDSKRAMFLQFVVDDSLDANIYQHIMQLVSTTPRSRYMLTRKRKGAKVRNRSIFDAMGTRYSGTQFKEHFCMSRTTFEVLLKVVGRHTKEFGPPPTANITLQTKILYTIWLLSKREPFPAVADRFDIPKSAEHEIFKYVVAILAALLPQYVQWPGAADQSISSQMFKVRSHGIPGIVGVIDQCHIEIDEPTDNAGDFLNNKKFHSIILQAVCDSWGRFIDVFVGTPGGAQAEVAFKSSPLFKKLRSQQHPLLREKQHLIGNAAYPLLITLLTPFSDNGKLLPNQMRYNNRLVTICSIVERALDMLKLKFQRLQHLDTTDAEFGTNIIAAACMLHNLIFNNGDMDAFNLRDICGSQTTDTYAAKNPSQEKPTKVALHKRHIIAQNL